MFTVLFAEFQGASKPLSARGRKFKIFGTTKNSISKKEDKNGPVEIAVKLVSYRAFSIAGMLRNAVGISTQNFNICKLQNPDFSGVFIQNPQIFGVFM